MHQCALCNPKYGMPNQYEFAERKTRICDKLLIVIYLYLQLNLSSFWFIIKQQWTIEEIFIFSNRSHLDWRQGRQTEFWKGTIPAKFGLIWVSVVSEEMISMWKFTKYDWRTDGRRRKPSDGKSSHGLLPGC